MKKGLRKSKAQLAAEKKAQAKSVAKAATGIIGIGLLAGTALVVGTNKVMSKMFKKDAAVEEQCDDCEE